MGFQTLRCDLLSKARRTYATTCFLEGFFTESAFQEVESLYVCICIHNQSCKAFQEGQIFSEQCSQNRVQTRNFEGYFFAFCRARPHVMCALKKENSSQQDSAGDTSPLKNASHRRIRALGRRRGQCKQGNIWPDHPERQACGAPRCESS